MGDKQQESEAQQDQTKLFHGIGSFIYFSGATTSQTKTWARLGQAVFICTTRIKGERQPDVNRVTPYRQAHSRWIDDQPDWPPGANKYRFSGLNP